MDLDQLVADVAARAAAAEGRLLVGIVGAPGSGKTSAATNLVGRLGPDLPAVRVPMDGFHLADVALQERGLLDRKGAIETFDAHGYLALLHRIRTETDHDVLAPSFERELEQPIAGAITVAPEHRVVVTEGNYLLDEDDPWPLVRASLDLVVFVELDRDRRRSRLVDRHVKYGKERLAAQAWVDDVDEPNALRVIARRDVADVILVR